MKYNTQDYWFFLFCSLYDILKKTEENTTFRKLDFLPSSGEGGDTNFRNVMFFFVSQNIRWWTNSKTQ
jgi:hypothetical protein